MRLTAGVFTLSAASASCACAAGTSAYNTCPMAATSTPGSLRVGTKFDCGGACGGGALPLAPLPVTSFQYWSAALSAAAAGKYTLIVTHAAIMRLASTIFSGKTRRIVLSFRVQAHLD